jgi:copper oxidase (laccase) domain-containing protein
VTAEEKGGRLSAGLVERIDPEARSRLRVCEIDGTVLLEACLPGLFRAMFTTRIGGESTGAFTSLNLDPRSDDDPGVVARNRARIAMAVGNRLVSPAQAHGLRVAGAAEYLRQQPGTSCDALTLHPVLDSGLAALLLFADCVPVVICGEVDMAVAHGGWRGILGGIVQEAGRAVVGPPAAAVIGPSIGPCCFTVSEQVAAAFAGRFGSEVVIGCSDNGESPRVDLWAATTKALGELGVRQDQVVNPRLCTACNRDFFYSYRNEGPVTGRQGCAAWVVAA